MYLHKQTKRSREDNKRKKEEESKSKTEKKPLKYETETIRSSVRQEINNKRATTTKREDSDYGRTIKAGGHVVSYINQRPAVMKRYYS